jgi:hypothetical protein
MIRMYQPIYFLWAALILINLLVLPSFAEEYSYPPNVSLEEVQAETRGARHEHPRLLVAKDELKNLAGTLKGNPLRKQLADLIIAQANAIQAEPPIEHKLKGKRLLSMSRTCVDRVLTLAMAYHLTGDRGYVERCEKEMLAAARFDDWNPKHFLDTAEMTCALGIGYDWLYGELEEGTRKDIRNAIVDKGLRVPFETKFNSWVRRTNNWGQVCHGGLTLGALAVMDEESEWAAKTIHNALDNVDAAMNAYAPHGSYPEGPSYWEYGTSYSVLLVTALETSLGTDFGLSNAPGFNETGGYPALVCGPSDQFFNYADGSAKRGLEPLRFWFAARYNRPDWLRDERELWEKTFARAKESAGGRYSRHFPLALLWLKNSGAARENVPVKLPLHWSSGGNVPITTHRSSWTDPRATFIGLKAGSPAESHGHMDIGSFVLDSDGVRWAVDLGSESYYGIESRNMDLWDRRQNSDRWTIFRLSNLGHNTLVIDGQLQRASGEATVEEFSDARQRPFSIVDMTQVYDDQAKLVRRGVRLLASREVLIQDELSGLQPGSRVRWQMITPGEPDALGIADVTLHQNGERLKLAIIVPKASAWTRIETEKPRHEWDSPNPDTRMVAFEAIAPESGELALTVVATPGSCTKPASHKNLAIPLSDWDRAQ